MSIYKSSAIRIGEPGSALEAGMPVPGNPGKFYENGQFAPDMDKLLSSIVAEADGAGLISTDLPFIKNGAIDNNALVEWSPYKDYSNKGIMVSDGVSKFSMAVIESMNVTFPEMYNSMGITSIMTADENDSKSRAIVGTQLITAITNTQGHTFKSTLVVHKEFEQYITVPIVKGIKDRTTGVSVSSYALYKAIGHIIFAKMAYEGDMKGIGDFMGVAGWSKNDTNNNQRGRYLSVTSRSSFRKDKENENSITEIEDFTPQDDFADTFAQYMTHRRYLALKSPEKYELMDSIMTRIY